MFKSDWLEPLSKVHFSVPFEVGRKESQQPFVYLAREGWLSDLGDIRHRNHRPELRGQAWSCFTDREDVERIRVPCDAELKELSAISVS